MKTTFEFIKSAIAQFFTLFEDRELRYVYSEDDNTHMFLLSEETLNSDEFANFDHKITTEAWGQNIEGLILFTASETMAELYDFEVQPNPNINDVLLGNLYKILDDNTQIQGLVQSDKTKDVGTKWSYLADEDYSYAMAA